MATIGTISLAKGDILTTAHVYSQNRANDGYGIISGCDVHQKTVPGMGVTIDAGVVMYDGTYTTVAGGDVVIDAADATNPRFDIIYVNAVGTCLVAKGTAAAILPTGETAFKKMTTPFPTASIPAGIILARVYVAATVTTILNAAIDDIAMVITQVPLNILTARGDIPYRNANTWARLAKSATSGHSLIQGANEPTWGYPSHSTLTDLTTGDPHTQYALLNGSAFKVYQSEIVSPALGTYGNFRAIQGNYGTILRNDGASFYISPTASGDQYGSWDPTKVGFAIDLATSRVSAGKGLDVFGGLAIDSSGMTIATNSNITNLNADYLDGLHSTDFIKKTENKWGYEVKFGNGSAVVVDQSDTSRAGIKACKITKIFIRCTDGAAPPTLVTDTFDVTLYVHDYNTEEGTAVDTFSLTAASSFYEGSLNIAVAADKWITISISGVDTAKLVIVSLEFEAT